MYELSVSHFISSHLISSSPIPSSLISSYLILGKYKIALPLVEKSIVLEPNYQYAFGYRGLLKHTLGWPISALKDLQKATQSISTVDYVVAALAGVCHTCLGMHCSDCNVLSSLTILYYTIIYCTILYYTILYYTIIYYNIIYYIILYYTILYYTILYHIILYNTIPYYTIPQSMVKICRTSIF